MKKKAQKRCTALESAKRNETVRELLLEGLSHKEIIAHCLGTDGWNVAESTVRSIIRAQEKNLKMDLENEKGGSLSVALSRLERAYADAVKRGDSAGVLRAIEISAKLSGLVVDKKQDIEKVDQLKDIDTKKLLRLLK